jgi:hypothetical protein
MKTEHTIGIVIIALLALDVYLEYLMYQELRKKQ